MIVASDLDRTLMYSKRALEELGRPEHLALKPVEMKNGDYLGYMTEKAFVSLQQLNEHCLFVPVTTRTTQQFKRFVIFEKEIPLTYVITSNGAHILFKGEQLKEWDEEVRKRRDYESASQQDLSSALNQKGFHFDGQWKEAEKHFFYYILNSIPTQSELRAIGELTGKYGWRISLQGRKLYFIPNAISKGNALQFICNREGMETIAGAGDSVLDWDFLKNCHNRFVPKHGELISHMGENDITVTKQSGISAGEEILQQFLSAISLKL